jgi:hypothetical protein
MGEAQIFKRGAPGVSCSHPNKAAIWLPRGYNPDLQPYSGPHRILRHFVGGVGGGGLLLGLSEGSPNQDDASGAKEHSEDGGDAHDGRPQSGLPLGHKVGLVVLVFLLLQLAFYSCLRKAIHDFERGDASTGVGYLFLGISGVFSSAISGVVIISGLIEQAYASAY